MVKPAPPVVRSKTAKSATELVERYTVHEPITPLRPSSLSTCKSDSEGDLGVLRRSATWCDATYGPPLWHRGYWYAERMRSIGSEGWPLLETGK